MRAGRDPLTGDLLKGSERFSLLVQSLMRRWAFVLAYTVVTVVWWTHPHWFGDQPNDGHWQDAASYAALVIESVVGIGMFGWARRDSLVLRRLEVLERKAQQADENNHTLLHELLRLSHINEQQMRLLTEIKRNGNGDTAG